MDWRGVQISVDKGANLLITLGMYGAERGLLVVRCALQGFCGFLVVALGDFAVFEADEQASSQKL